MNRSEPVPRRARPWYLLSTREIALTVIGVALGALLLALVFALAG